MTMYISMKMHGWSPHKGWWGVKTVAWAILFKLISGHWRQQLFIGFRYCIAANSRLRIPKLQTRHLVEGLGPRVLARRFLALFRRFLNPTALYELPTTYNTTRNSQPLTLDHFLTSTYDTQNPGALELSAESSSPAFRREPGPASGQRRWIWGPIRGLPGFGYWALGLEGVLLTPLSNCMCIPESPSQGWD